MKKSIILLVLIFFQFSIHAQVVAFVFDQDSQEPLLGAWVQTDTDSVVTDAQGKLLLSRASLPVEILVKYVGYQSKVFTIEQNNAHLYLEPSQTALNEVVVLGGTQYGKIKNTSSSISLVNHEMIRRDDPFSTTSALNRVPGLYMHSGSMNTSRITIRGIGSRNLFGTNKIKAYFGQIPLNDGSGTTDIDHLDQSMIARMEVSKGPNSTIYGAGLAGVIRIVPPGTFSNERFLSSSLTVGSFGNLRHSTALQMGGERYNLIASYATTSSEGYRDNSNFKREQAGLSGMVRLSERVSIDFLTLYTNLKGFIPSAINETTLKENPTAAAPTWAAARGFESYQRLLAGINIHADLTSNWKVTSAFFGTLKDAYEPRPFNILDEQTTGIGNRSILSFKSGRLDWSTGTELFADLYRWGTSRNLFTPESNGSVLGDRVTHFEEKRSYVNVFSELKYTFSDDWILTGGLNFNQTNYRRKDIFQVSNQTEFENNRFDPVLSPRIGLVYNPVGFLSLYSNISHGFSPPALDETLNPDGSVNPEIRPETGWNYEMGTRGNFKGLYYDVAIYYMSIRNLLVARRTADDQYVGVNAGKNNHLGADLSINYFYEWAGSQTLNVFLTGSLNHFRFADFLDDGNDFSGNKLTGVPDYQLSPGLEWISEKGFYGNLNAQLVGRIPINDSNELFSDAYNIWRGRVGYKLSWKWFKLDTYTGVNNIMNQSYVSMLLINATAPPNIAPRYYYPGLPRNFYGGASLKVAF